MGTIVRRNDASSPAVKVYAPSDRVTLAEAIDLLADRDRRKHDSDRGRKARMRHHIQSAVRNHQLTEKNTFGTKHYEYGRLAAWAQDKWRGRYDDFLATRDPIVNSVAGTLGRLLGKSSGYQIPSDPAECQAQLHHEMRRIATLEEKLTSAREEIDRLRPDAEAYRRVCAGNATNAKQRRPKV